MGQCGSGEIAGVAGPVVVCLHICVEPGCSGGVSADQGHKLGILVQSASNISGCTIAMSASFLGIHPPTQFFFILTLRDNPKE